jgi:hypothetical protein
MQRERLQKMIAEASKSTEKSTPDSTVPVSELIKESIFDTDEIKQVKGFMV